ncbi:MAG: hypothetical protein IJ180_04705 [Bacteroidales bacterium]|nr:hypothetical protein [Bacteroidales bacterium]
MNEYAEIMLMDNVISVSFEEIYTQICEKYKYLNGVNKFNSIYYKVMSSKKLTNLIMESKTYRLSLDYKIVLSAMNETAFFMFKKNKTQFVGLVIFYKRWNDEVNKSLKLASDEYLREQCRRCYNGYAKY